MYIIVNEFAINRCFNELSFVIKITVTIAYDYQESSLAWQIYTNHVMIKGTTPDHVNIHVHYIG